MTTESAIALSASVASIAWGVYVFGWRLGRLELKVDTLWQFSIRRAKAETAIRGLGEMQSPNIHLTLKGKAAILPFLPKFLPLYIELVKRDATEIEMYQEFEQRFGDWILENICIPLGLMGGACLTIILETCKEVPHSGNIR